MAHTKRNGLGRKHRRSRRKIAKHSAQTCPKAEHDWPRYTAQTITHLNNRVRCTRNVSRKFPRKIYRKKFRGHFRAQTGPENFPENFIEKIFGARSPFRKINSVGVTVGLPKISPKIIPKNFCNPPKRTPKKFSIKFSGRFSGGCRLYSGKCREKFGP